MNFLSLVRDQTVNLAPSGVDAVLVPRLEGWVAACELYDIPRERRASLVSMARCLFDGVHDRLTVRGLHLMDPSELAELPAEGHDG